MHLSKPLLTTATVLAAALLLCGGHAGAQPFGPDPTRAIGINFVNTNLSGIHGVGLDDRFNSLLPEEIAGAYAQSNWNNAGASGGGSFVVTNHAGNPVNLTLNWDSTFTETTGTATGLGTPEGKLMDGFLSTWGPGTNTTLASSVYGSAANNKPLVYIRGLQSWYSGISGAEGYAVVLYTKGYSYWQLNEGWVQAVSGDPLASTLVEGGSLTPHLYRRDNAGFFGTYARIASTDPNNPTYDANYMFFSGLTNDAVLLRVQSPQPNYTSSLNAFQLLPAFPEPASASTPTFSPGDTIYANETATLTEVASGCPFHPELSYQWQSDYGSAIPLTFSSMPDATNATVSLTPSNNIAPYAVNFRIIVTNVHGASTSSIVTLNVNPAVPPYITQDTTPGPSNGVATAYAYVGGSITFSAAFGGPAPILYNWQSNSVNIANATNTSLTLANLQMSSAASYSLAAHNQLGSTTSAPTPLTVIAAPAAPVPAVAYPYAVYTNSPVAYWRLDETLDNFNNSVQAYDYSGNHRNGTYGAGGYLNQYAGLVSPAYPGFEPLNVGAYFIRNSAGAFVTVPELNLNTNTVTLTAWIYPTAAQTPDTGIFMWANGGTKAGLRFGGNSVNEMAELGYLWNSSSGSTDFHSGLYPPLNAWSFVALTITPSNSTIYLYYVDSTAGTTNLFKAGQSIANAPASFNGGTTWIGSDTTASRNFNGYMDEVAVFGRALGEGQIQDLFLKAIGVSGVAPVITQQPAGAIGPMYAGQEIEITAGGGGAPAPGYRWQSSPPGMATYTDLVNGSGVAGADAGTLSLSGGALAASRDYRAIAFNASGSATSTVCAVTLTPVPTNGLWTVRYQVTNTSGYLGWVDGYGSGSYTGAGILGAGSFWNPVPGGGQWWGGPFYSASSFRDDGTTASGITCTFPGGQAIAAAAAGYPSNDRRGLHSQFLFYFGPSTNGLVLSGVPNGTYNLAFHGICSPWNDRGTTFTVHGTNGDQSASTTNTSQFQYFVEGENAVVITNVQVAGGTLNVDLTATPVVPSHNPNDQFAVNAVEVQIVSYAPPTAGFSAASTNVFVSQPVTFVNAASPVTNLFWDFGDGHTLNTTTNGNVSHAYASPGSYTVSQTVTGPGGTASMTNTAYITVAPKPAIDSVAMSSGGIVLSGASGIAGMQYRILSSTDLTLPLANWTPVWTNVFGPGGVYSYTNSPTTNPASFFILVTP